MARKADRHLVFGIIGSSLSHSLSPVIHNHFFHKAGLNFRYGTFEVEADCLPACIGGIRSLGIGGVNVTHPYKQAVIPYLDDVSKAAAQIGAVNTIKNIRGKLIGHNTDLAGIRSMLIEKLGLKLTGQSVVVLGAGGAASACVSELLRARAGHIRIINRTPTRAERMVESLPLARHRSQVKINAISNFKKELKHEPPLLIINSTSATPGQLRKIIKPLIHSESPGSTVFWDLNYGSRALSPESVPKSLQYVDGLYMLAAQAAESFRLWTGRRLEHEAVYRFLKRKINGR